MNMPPETACRGRMVAPLVRGAAAGLLATLARSGTHARCALSDHGATFGPTATVVDTSGDAAHVARATILSVSGDHLLHPAHPGPASTSSVAVFHDSTIVTTL